nr:recombinase family protein [Candidatus Microthrix sp.]
MNGHKGQIVGYARVSAADQNEARQVEAMSDVDRLFCEKVSGKNVEDRTQLRELLEWVRDGDKVRVKSPDRLARSTRDLLDLIEQFHAKGVALEFVDNPALNTDTPQGAFMLTILGARRPARTPRSKSAKLKASPSPNGTASTNGPRSSPPSRWRTLESGSRPTFQRQRSLVTLGCLGRPCYSALGGKGTYA